MSTNHVPAPAPGMSSGGKMLVGLVVIGLAAVILFIWWATRHRLVIKDGVEYRILSYAATQMSRTEVTRQGKEKVRREMIIPTYTLTITYLEGDGLSRTTIQVPREALTRDTFLGDCRIVWDPPYTVEGREYRSVRWGPTYDVPNREEPVIREGKPPTR